MGRSQSRSWLPLSKSSTSRSPRRILLTSYLTSASAYGFVRVLKGEQVDPEVAQQRLQVRLLEEAVLVAELAVRASCNSRLW